RIENVCVIESACLSPVDTRSSESIPFGPAVGAIEARVKYLRPLKTVSDEERIVVSNLMVDLHIERFGIFRADCGLLKVVGEPWERRRGHKAENFFSDGADAVSGNDVAVKRLPARAIGIPGSRIVNDLWCR